MTRYHKVHAYLRRSMVKRDRPPKFYEMTEALRRETNALRKKCIIRVKAVGRRVPA